jgi:hypothetical protein
MDLCSDPDPRVLVAECKLAVAMMTRGFFLTDANLTEHYDSAIRESR